MKYLLILLMLSSCATMSGQTDKLYCGEIGPINIYIDKNNGFVTCDDAMQTTQAAYILLWQKLGLLKNTLNVEYTYKYIEYTDFDFSPFKPGVIGSIPTGLAPIPTLATFYPDKNLIMVNEKHPKKLLHQLLLAYLYEN